MDTASALYIEELLLGARFRHDIFYDDFVVQAFYEAEKAHRGQVKTVNVIFCVSV